MDPLLLVAVGMLVVVTSILWLRLHAFLALLLGALIVAWLTPADNLAQYAASARLPPDATKRFLEQTPGERLATAFGDTCGKLGLVIALAAIIGKCLLDSGAADRIVRSTLHWMGESRAPLAFLVSGFFLGIPVFFDTVFLLLLPLGKAMAGRDPRNYLLYILSIIAGSTMAHSLVPPTPGPLAVAGMLQVSLGAMMVGGIVVGLCTIAVGYAYAAWANARWPLPLRETADVSVEELQSLATEKEHNLPPFWLAILPIALPLVLITLGEAAPGIHSLIASRSAGIAQDAVAEPAVAAGRMVTVIRGFSDPSIALTLGAAISVVTLVWQKRLGRAAVAAALQSALLSAGVIILITCAGGMFGSVLQHTAVAQRIAALAGPYGVALLPLAFLLSALLRTAQGSATVAMITAASILQGFSVSPESLGYHPVYLALAIGCGSKVFPWMNDSGFWIIGRMCGLTEAETLKTSSAMMAIMGTAGIALVLLLAWLAPMTG